MTSRPFGKTLLTNGAASASGAEALVGDVEGLGVVTCDFGFAFCTKAEASNVGPKAREQKRRRNRRLRFTAMLRKIWSAVTCHRFVRRPSSLRFVLFRVRKPAAAILKRRSRQVAALQSWFDEFG